MPSEPFRGIEPFRFSDQAIYSERREQAVRLVKTVVIYRGSLLAGASGVGKSSLINAGFLPNIIREGYLPERVRGRPEPGCEFQFERIPVGDVDQPLFLPSRFDSERVSADHGSTSLSGEEFTKTVSASHPAGPALLIFDQFEELITLFEEAPENRAKIEAAQSAQLAIFRTLSQLVLSLIRIVDRWVVNSYTSTMAPTPLLICLVLALKNGKFRGSRVISVRPKAPSGTEFQPRRTPVLFQGDDDGGVNVIFTVPFIVQETGTHWFEIFLDETFVTKLPLTVAFQTVAPDQPVAPA